MDLADLGPTAKNYLLKKAERLAADKKAAALKSEEDKLKATIISACRVTRSGVDLVDVTIEYKTKDVPKASDWEAIHRYIVENDAPDIMQKRLHEGACKERWDDGVDIPGIYKDESESITVKER